MDRVEKHQHLLTQWLADYAKIKPANLPNVVNHVIIDREHGHYQLLREGWSNQDFIFNIVFHFSIKPDGKIWVLANNTDIEIDEEFKQLGVADTDLIPGFIPTEWRQQAGYAA